MGNKPAFPFNLPACAEHDEQLSVAGQRIMLHTTRRTPPLEQLIQGEGEGAGIYALWERTFPFLKSRLKAEFFLPFFLERFSLS